LQATDAALGLEAAGWLRMFMQAGVVTQPEDIFETLVAATVLGRKSEEALDVLRTYLKLIFDCFWPFRDPYPAYSWHLFPSNKMFYPLAPLFKLNDYETQDALIGIFAELPRLNDPEILRYLLPVVLQ